MLAILAIVTALAVRSLDGVEDQRRFEAAHRGLDEIEFAVLGSPDDRAADGSRTGTVSGFVADMGRPPKPIAETIEINGTPESVFTLRELWQNPGAAFSVRAAVDDNGVALADEDNQVFVPGGWRGPYLRLPLGAKTLLDGWGNPIISPNGGTSYARLRDAADNPITAVNADICFVRILGANGQLDDPNISGYDREEAITFTGNPPTTLNPSDDKFRASLSGNVGVLKSNGTPAPLEQFPEHDVTIRVFGPSAADPSKIFVVRLSPIPFEGGEVSFTIPSVSGVTIGPRIIRAYLHPRNPADPAAFWTNKTVRHSTVKHVTLRGGDNSVNLTIDRP